MQTRDPIDRRLPSFCLVTSGEDEDSAALCLQTVSHVVVRDLSDNYS